MATDKSAESAAAGSPDHPPAVRYVAPDLARGFMLLMIAVANIAYWLPASASDPDQMTLADRCAVLIRTMLTDQAGYPLFAVLLGYGAAVLAARYTDAGTSRGLSLSTARLRARTKLRWRGVWLLVFGAVLGLFFTVEILGTYGLVTVLVAHMVVFRRTKTMIAVAAAVVITNLSVMWFLGVVGDPGGGTAGWNVGSGTPLGLLMVEQMAVWISSAVFAVPLSLVVPGVLLGVWLAGTDIVSAPQRHRKLLVGVIIAAVVGTSLTAPYSLYVAGFWSQAPSWSMAGLSLGGFTTGMGFLALVLLVASSPTVADSKLGGMVISLGQHSLTGYIAQIAAMGLLMVMAFIGGSWVQMGAVEGVLFAVLIWVWSLIFCDVLSDSAYARPAERLLRWSVSSSAKDELVVPPASAGRDEVTEKKAVGASNLG